MKKNNLQSLFPEISETAIASLPEDLTVCWYPSSGAETEMIYVENNCFLGYCAVHYWETQPSKLKPNFFIFTDVAEFEIATTYDLVFSMDINKDLNFEKEELTPIDYDSFKDNYLQEIFLSSAIEEYAKKKADIEKRYMEQLGKIHLIKKDNLYVLLVRCENEKVYQRFIQNNIKVPLLTLNRTMDSFIHFRGINLDLLGVQEIITNTGEARNMNISEEFQVFPDFYFQSQAGFGDIVNLYSRVKGD